MRYALLLLLLTGCVATVDHSGFISGELVLSAKHFEGTRPTLAIPIDSGRSMLVQVDLRYENGQLAILHGTIPGQAKNYSLASSPARETQRVWVINAWSGSKPLEGSVLTPDSLVLTDGSPVPRGASGSPIIDNEGQVVGIVGGNIYFGDNTIIFFYPLGDILRAIAEWQLH